MVGEWLLAGPDASVASQVGLWGPQPVHTGKVGKLRPVTEKGWHRDSWGRTGSKVQGSRPCSMYVYITPLRFLPSCSCLTYGCLVTPMTFEMEARPLKPL